MSTIELAMFRLMPETDLAEFEAALMQTNQWLTTQAGFVRRQHGADDAGGRVDIVEWVDMASAQAASKNFMAAPETRAYLAAIDPGSISMHHYGA